MIIRTECARLCALLFAASLLAGCSGGGSEGAAGTGPGTPAASVAAPVASVGAVTGFGSVFVNGVRFDTSRAVFDIDGRIGLQSDLDVGDRVVVKGTLAADGKHGTADRIEFDDNVEGPITAIDAGAGTLLVLGQTVRVGPETSFDDSIAPRSLAGLAVGDVVEVSGLVASDGSITASRIEKKPAGGELEVTGLVASHDAVAKRFNINALVVDYSTAQLEDFPSGSIANGQRVEVKGRTINAGVLVATRVELKANDVAGAPGDHREVEGFVSRFVSATDFDVAGVHVTTNAQTVFMGGTAADLGLDIKVEVEGALDAAGVLVATKVAIRRASVVRVRARVDSVDAAAGTFVVLGITVKVDELTRVEDESSQHMRPFDLSNLNVGEFVEVRGGESPAGSGQVLAARLEREDGDDHEDDDEDECDSSGPGSGDDCEDEREDECDSSGPGSGDDCEDEREDECDSSGPGSGDDCENECEDSSGHDCGDDGEDDRGDDDDGGEDDGETVLQGFVQTVAEPTLTILGVTIETDNLTEFEDVNDDSLSASAFFDVVAPGALVKAEGAEVADTELQADEVELED